MRLTRVVATLVLALAGAGLWATAGTAGAIPQDRGRVVSAAPATPPPSPPIPSIPPGARPPGVRQPVIGGLAILSLVVAGAAGLWIYLLIRKGI